MTPKKNSSPAEMPIRRIIKTWWPLAASWFMMSLELTILSAVMARMANPEINLAAYGGIVYAISLIIEAPIIMLLSASTALSKDMASYRQIRRYMLWMAAAVTVIHILAAFTPLYYFITETLIAAPQEIIEPARLGLMIMTPWSAAIAYRRFNQGVLIRFGHSEAVATGTIIRLLANAAMVILSLSLGTISGVATAAMAQAFGVVSEAVYSGLRVQPVLRKQVQFAPPIEPIPLKGFIHFYIPLALTSLMTFIWQPIGSAAISRMPQALESLAIWPVVYGLAFMLRSFGVAYNEVVVALLDEKGSYRSLKRFAGYLAAALLGLGLLATAQPISALWFNSVSALSDPLTRIAQVAFLIALPIAPLVTYQSWFQGVILNGRKTRSIPESVAVFLVTAVIILGVGVAVGNITGIYVAMAAYTLSNLTQTLWLGFRSRPILNKIRIRDENAVKQEAEII